MTWKSFFYFFGLSCKPLDYDKGIRGNRLSLWSASINVILLIIVVLECIFGKFVTSYWSGHILRRLALNIFSVTAAVNLISAHLNESNEDFFWGLHDRSRKSRNYKATRSLKLKNFLEILNLAINFLGWVIVTVQAGLYIGISEVGRLLPCHIAYKVSIIKFCYFMDVLSFQLDELNRLVLSNKKKESAEQLKLCWKMKQQINKIFGWSLMFICGMLIVAAVSALNSNYENLGLNRYTFSVAFAYIEVLTVALTCQKIATKQSAIKTLLFSRANGPNEMLILQMLHQNLEVSPLQICRINHQFIVSV